MLVMSPSQSKSKKVPVCSDDCLHGSLTTNGNSLFSAVVDGGPVYLTAGSEESAIGALISRGAVGVRQYLNSHCIEPIQETYPAFDGARWGVPGGDDETDTGGYPAGESDSIASRQLRSGRPDVDDFLSREFITLKFSEVEFAKRCQLWLTKSHGFPAGVVVAGESESWLLYRLQFDQSADERILENGRQRLATMTADIRKRLQESLHDASGGDTSELFAKLEAVRAECEILTDADFESLWASGDSMSDEQEFREETGDSLHYRPFVESIAKRFGIHVESSCGLDASIPVLVIGEAVEILASDSEEWKLNVTESTLAKMVDELTEESALWSPGGVLQEWIQFNLITAHKQQPELALISAVAGFATLCGRKVTDDYGTMPNVYLVGIAPSSAGKQHPMNVNKLVISKAAGSSAMLQDGLASHAGLHRALEVSPSTLLQSDEMGRLMSVLGDSKKVPPHLAGIIDIWLKLFSSSSTVYLAPAYADRRQNFTIEHPNFCLYGTSVPQNFYGALTKEALSDGLFNRFLIVEVSNGDPELQKPAPMVVPECLAEATKWWWNYKMDPFADGSGPRVLVTSTEAEKEFLGLQKTIRKNQRAEMERGTTIWGRTWEYSRKLALIHQCSLDREAVEISGASAKWACAFVLKLTERMEALATAHVASGEFDSLGLKLLRFIREGGAGGRLRGEISRHVRNLNPRDLDNVLTKLELNEEIKRVPFQPATGRPTWSYLVC